MPAVNIIDVSPRDGLQISPDIVSTEDKVTLIKKLLEAGVTRIEATSFVRADKVPQMADAEEVASACEKLPDAQITVLIPNLKGFERAMEVKVSEVNWVTSASETFNQKNVGISIAESFRQFEVLVGKARPTGVNVGIAIAVSFGCPYEGEVDQGKVVSLVEQAINMGADRVTVADTIGIATPGQVKSLMSQVLEIAGQTPIGIHLHDTRGLGLANAYAAYEAGVRIFEAAASGIGGCPFAPGAAGNLATEDLVYMFEKMNIHTGVNFERLIDAADFAASLSSHIPLGRIRHIQRSL